MRGTRAAVVNTACDHAAFLLTHAEGGNPFDASMFFDTSGGGKKLCIRNLLFIDRTAPHLVVGKLQNRTTLNLGLVTVENVRIHFLPSTTGTQLLTVDLYHRYCPRTPPASARHPPSSVASSSVFVAKLTALGALGNRRLEDPLRWPEDVAWEKCHLRPSKQSKDLFAKDQDNRMIMSVILHSAFDGRGSLASIIIEPTEVVLPSLDSTSGTVSVRAYFKDIRLLNTLFVRPEAHVEDDNRGDGPVSVVLTLSDPRPARFAAFLLYKAEFERHRASLAGHSDAWSPPTAVPNSSEGLTTLLTADGYNLYLQLQGNCTYITGDGQEVEVDIMRAISRSALRGIPVEVLQRFLTAVCSDSTGTKETLITRVMSLQALASGGASGGASAGAGGSPGAGAGGNTTASG